VNLFINSVLDACIHIFHIFLLFIVINTIILELNHYDIKDTPAIITSLNPKIIFNNIIFKDFSLTSIGNLDGWKLILLISVSILYYAIFCFLTAIKRIFGFPKE
jgi:hypothetical protein